MSAVGADGSTVAELAASCERCVHRLDGQRAIEQRMPGLTSLGSAYGASIATSRLCGVHDCWVSPGDGCSQFSSKG